MTNKFAPAMISPVEFNSNLLKCWRRLQAGRKISVHRSIIQITDDDVKSAIFLSQLMYWLRVGTEIISRDGWIFKSIQETETETGLTKAEQRSCKKHLEQLGFIEAGHFGQGKKLAFRVNLEAISKAVCNIFDLDDITQLTLEDWRKQELSFIRDYFSDSIVYHMDLVRLTGDIYIAIMLSTALHNSARHGSPGTRSFTRQRLYYTATIEQWKQDTFLGRKTQERGRHFLHTHGLFSEAHYFQNSRIFTHVNSDMLMSMLDKNIRLAKVTRPVKQQIKNGQQSLLTDESETSPDLVSAKTDISEVSKGTSPDLVSAKTDISEVSKGTSPDLVSAKTDTSEVSKGTSPDLVSAKTDTSEVSKGTSPDLVSAKTDISEVSKGTSPDLVSAKTDISEVSKGTSPDLISAKTDISEVLKGTSNIRKYYNNLPSEDKTTTTNIDGNRQNHATEQNVVVVISDDEKDAFKPMGKYQSLIFPTNLKKGMHPQALKIFSNYLPHAKTEILQELLDEVGGYESNASNPLGLLSRMAREAAAGSFVAVKAPQYKSKRIAILKHNQALAEAVESQNKLEQSPNEAGLTDNSVISDAVANMKNILAKKSSILK